MSTRDKRLVECTSCYTLTSYLNGVCPECGGNGVVEEKEPPPPPPPGILHKDKVDPKSTLD